MSVIPCIVTCHKEQYIRNNRYYVVYGKNGHRSPAQHTCKRPTASHVALKPDHSHVVHHVILYAFIVLAIIIMVSFSNHNLLGPSSTFGRHNIGHSSYTSYR